MSLSASSPAARASAPTIVQRLISSLALRGYISRRTGDGCAKSAWGQSFARSALGAARGAFDYVLSQPSRARSGMAWAARSPSDGFGPSRCCANRPRHLPAGRACPRPGLHHGVIPGSEMPLAHQTGAGQVLAGNRGERARVAQAFRCRRNSPPSRPHTHHRSVRPGRCFPVAKVRRHGFANGQRGEYPCVLSVGRDPFAILRAASCSLSVAFPNMRDSGLTRQSCPSRCDQGAAQRQSRACLGTALPSMLLTGTRGALSEGHDDVQFDGPLRLPACWVLRPGNAQPIVNRRVDCVKPTCVAGSSPRKGKMWRHIRSRTVEEVRFNRSGRWWRLRSLGGPSRI